MNHSRRVGEISHLFTRIIIKVDEKEKSQVI